MKAGSASLWPEVKKQAVGQKKEED